MNSRNRVLTALLILTITLGVGLSAKAERPTPERLVGQMADIAPSAYQYRADRKADQNPPESWLALKHYAGQPLNKRVVRAIRPGTVVVYGLLVIASLLYLGPIYLQVVTGFKSFREVNIATMWRFPHAFSLASFVKGEFTAEMMLDTVWTLSHNNGPIFNKSVFYAHYDAANLLRILDVQRSGQVPEAILHDKVIGDYSESALMLWMIQLSERFPEIGAYVDWFKVEALGGLGSYVAGKNEQAKLYGVPPEVKASQAKAFEEANKKAGIEAAQAALAKAEFDKKYFTVMPNVHVEKFQRAA